MVDGTGPGGSADCLSISLLVTAWRLASADNTSGGSRGLTRYGSVSLGREVKFRCNHPCGMTLLEQILLTDSEDFRGGIELESE